MEAKNMADIYDLPLLDWPRSRRASTRGWPRRRTPEAPTDTPPGWPRSTPTGARTSPASGRHGPMARSGS
jgi:hypothetical protein